MKKLMLLFIITGIGLSQIYAQGEPKSGIKASSYISNYLLKDLENCQSIMKTGISFGGFMIIGITDLWAIQPELMIQYKKSKIENQSEKATSEYKCWAVEMPVYAVIQKKLVLSLAVILGLGLSQVNAQISGGVKAGANMSNYFLKDMGGSKSKMKVGATIGGFAKYEFNDMFAVQGDLLFHYKASEFENKALRTKTDMEYWGMEIPVYGIIQKNFGTGKGYFGAGPYVGLRFSNENDGTDLYDHDTMHRFDFGVGCMIGYELGLGLQINAGYQVGLINTLDSGKGDSKMRTQTISLGLAYRF